MRIFKRDDEQAAKTAPPADASSGEDADKAATLSPKGKAAVWNQQPLEGVHRVIAIGSGKGGVGKSTTTVMLAHALAAQGMGVGILDADIYGPSIPHMLGLTEKGQPVLHNGKMRPHQAGGIVCNSMGFLMPADGAAIWRGPMITKALHQLARLTMWNDSTPGNSALDVLLTDLPPGTGDIHLSMVQQVPLDGALIVTTPQQVALLDARKAADMFRKVRVPILGVIENMSWLEDGSGQKHRLFGEGGGQALAKELGVPLLAQIPLRTAITDAMDHGQVPSFSDVQSYYPVIQALL